MNYVALEPPTLMTCAQLMYGTDLNMPLMSNQMVSYGSGNAINEKLG